jgi:lysozyme
MASTSLADARSLADTFADRALAMIERHEGRRVRAYRDTMGLLTVGVGFSLERPDARSRIARLGVDYDALCRGEAELSEAQIDRLLGEEVAITHRAVRHVYPDYDGFPEAARLVILDLAYNVGVAGLGTFVHFLDAVRARDWLRAIAELRDSTWFHQVGTRAEDDCQLLASLCSPSS